MYCIITFAILINCSHLSLPMNPPKSKYIKNLTASSLHLRHIKSSSPLHIYPFHISLSFQNSICYCFHPFSSVFLSSSSFLILSTLRNLYLNLKKNPPNYLYSHDHFIAVICLSNKNQSAQNFSFQKTLTHLQYPTFYHS